MTGQIEEGWAYVTNSRKWHYYKNRTSLCGRMIVLGRVEYEQGNDDSSDNCAACRKKLAKEGQV